MKIEYIQKCKCGGVTISFDNGASNSMFWETFEKLDLDTGDATWLHQSFCCDHCVNHWGGIDLNGLKIPCYVLEDGRRVLSTTGMQNVLGLDDPNDRSGKKLVKILS